ncbi:MAG: ATP synthase F1 subunit gamma [Alistipes sp.]|nr:ATP synthase F1 subunit gamma [Alistipes sp.]MDD7712093.1 ATP synthase F1 subunit gamma [Alistipes sp.]
MPSLKEIKGRINSISSTLAITSAMKMVASAKLQKAQMAIQNMLPYERRLHSMLIDLMGAVNMSAPASEEGSARLVSLSNQPDHTESEGAYSLMAQREVRKVAIVAFASNSSLCGAFNSNVIREATAVINEYRASGLGDADITVYSVGRKMAEAMKKLGFPSPADFTKMSDSPSYDAASALAQELLDGFVSGRFDKVELVYNHYKSTSSQPTIRQTYLPLSLADATADLQAGKIADSASESDTNRGAEPVGAPVVRQGSPTTEDLIVEPSKEELIATLLPKVVRLRVFTTLLDSTAAEQAARTVAMQLATDNGNDLLQELTLEYNKGRQQKITSEILDLVGGSMQ